VKKTLNLPVLMLLAALALILAACDPFGSDSGDSTTGCYSDGCDIAGHITTEAGKPLEGVKVELSGGESGYVVTDRNGYYELIANTMMRNYCVTPSKGPWEFDPPQHCIKDLAQNYTDRDFVAAHVESFDISGQVFNMTGPLKDVMVFLTGHESKNVRTNSQGFYAFYSLRGREDYCVSCFKDGLAFEPPQRCYTYLDSIFDDEDYLATEAE
jgi:hypothetical protein